MCFEFMFMFIVRICEVVKVDKVLNELTGHYD